MDVVATTVPWWGLALLCAGVAIQHLARLLLGDGWTEAERQAWWHPSGEHLGIATQPSAATASQETLTSRP